MKNVVITGSTRGIGLSMAREFPVSYTHLDVYKRQGSSSSVWYLYRNYIVTEA